MKRCVIDVVNKHFNCDVLSVAKEKTDGATNPVKHYTAYLLCKHVPFYSPKAVSDILGMSESSIRLAYSRQDYLDKDVLQSLEDVLQIKLRILEDTMN